MDCDFLCLCLCHILISIFGVGASVGYVFLIFGVGVSV